MMRNLRRGVVLLLGTLWVGLVVGQSNGLRMEACREKNQILWKNKEAHVYYMCYDKKEALKMRCPAGSYMCKKPNTAFKPCDCNKKEFYDGTGILPSDEEDTTPYSSSGCPADTFELKKGHHMFAGREYIMKTVRACQDKCLDDNKCIGLDWDQKGGKCYILKKDSLNFGGPYASKNADHYKRCPRKPETTEASTHKFPDPRQARPDGPNSIQGGPSPTDGFTPPGLNSRTTRTRRPPTPSRRTPPTPVVTRTTTSTTTTTTEKPTTTIPDTGCPYALHSYPGQSHPFGKNITNGTLFSTVESCKQYCVYRPWCKGVDFNMMTNTCFEQRSINNALLVPNSAVTHFQKTTCPPPLRCYVAGSAQVSSANVAIQTPGASQKICNGVCFVRETMEATRTTVERGCMEGSGFTIGCMVGMNGTSQTMLTTMTCLCDTDRCNGLSANALAAQILHLPLDGDFRDASGFGRHGVPVDLNNPPQFSMMDRAVNTSAVFTGSQCIKIPSLIDAELGPINQDMISPQMSVALWHKLLSSGSTSVQGMFGNSLDETEDPSFRVVAQDGFVKAGVRTESDNNAIDDFNFATAPAGQWNLDCMAYDGRLMQAMGITPKLQLDIYGTASEKPIFHSSNDQNSGLLSSTNKQPPVIGCAQGLAFTGFIDEVRIFLNTLMKEDCLALRAMNDAFV